MSVGTNQQAFYKKMDIARASGVRPAPVEIARFAVEAGLNVRETLREIRAPYDYRFKNEIELADSPALFISLLCEKSNATRILEYSGGGNTLLTASLKERGDKHQLTYISRDQDFVEALQLLFHSNPSLIITGIPELPSDTKYDAIICIPPIGFRPAGDGAADGFGGEVVRELAPSLSDGGTLYWITTRGALFTPRGEKTRSKLEEDGLHTVAVIDIAPGVFSGTNMPGAVIVLRRELSSKKFVGALRDIETVEPMVLAFLSGPTKKDGPSWSWLENNDPNTFGGIEQDRLLKKLKPRGNHKTMALGSLLSSENIKKADKPVVEVDQVEAPLFIPEYAGSRVSTDLDEQTVKPKSVYRLLVNSAMANPRYLARLLNSPFGKQLRGAQASGTTIQRISVASLLSLELPIPDIETQDRIVRIDGDIGLMQTAFKDMHDALDQDWGALTDIAEKIDGLKAVLDTERQIADWWSELPYPLATIYRRYQVSTEPKERLDTLLHFFEMAAVYLAAIGVSHVKALRQDWQEIIAKWLHPSEAAGIERADFGFWIKLASASLKDMRRIASDKDLSKSASEIAGPGLVQVSSTIGTLGKATDVLDVARRYRNSWIGHGGLIKPSDAERLDGELQQSIRDFYQIASPIFRNFKLVRPGMAEGTDTGMKYQVEVLTGSDPTFEKCQIELDQHAKSNVLAFWMSGERSVCHAVPFFRLGAPEQPQETSFYVFNRVENEGLRWISYQESREQEIVAPDDELLGLIALGKELE
jgi:hypothetical protein